MDPKLSAPDPLWTLDLQIPATLTPVTKEPNMDALQPTPPTFADRVRNIWAIVETYVEQLVGGVEMMYGPGTGAEKKAKVEAQALAMLKLLEMRVNLIPGPLEPVVWFVLERGLDFTIEKAVARLRQGGLLNMIAGAPAAS